MDKPEQDQAEKPQEELTLSARLAAAGRKGGLRTRRRYGLDHFSAIGEKGGEMRRQALGREGYAEMGRKSGEAKRARKAAGK